MQSLLEMQVNALRVWIGEALSDAERLSRDPTVNSAVLALLDRAERAERAERAGDSPQALEQVGSSAERVRVDAVLRPLLADEGSAGHNVISPQGRLLSIR